jgi:fermentation-respiration switch protein FrsA (DUF1100 family)
LRGGMAAALAGPIEWLKNTLTFHPDTKLISSPSDHELPYEEVRFGGADGRTLHGWYIPSRSRDGAEWLFLWFHGNAGHIGHRLKQLRLLHERIGGSHFLFDYQGFGLSHGKPTLAGIMQDGRDVLDFVRARGWAERRHVVYFGESLGCAVVLTLALEQQPDSVILSAPFYSLRAMGKIRVPPLAFLAEHDLNNARLIGQLTTPLLVIHGTHDRTVPFQQGYDLYALAAQPKTFLRIEGGGHTNLHEVGGELYLRTIRDFMPPVVST